MRCNCWKPFLKAREYTSSAIPAAVWWATFYVGARGKTTRSAKASPASATLAFVLS